MSELAKNLNCSARVMWSTSKTTPLPKVGTLNSYTSFWDISWSRALKKCSETLGPIKNVMRLWNTGTARVESNGGAWSAANFRRIWRSRGDVIDGRLIGTRDRDERETDVVRTHR